MRVGPGPRRNRPGAARPKGRAMKPEVSNGPRSAVPRLFSIATVAAHLDVSQKTVRRWIAAGELTVHQIGGQLRVSEPDLAAFLARARRS